MIFVIAGWCMPIALAMTMFLVLVGRCAYCSRAKGFFDYLAEFGLLFSSGAIRRMIVGVVKVVWTLLLSVTGILLLR
jgi:hypothetical protein